MSLIQARCPCCGQTVDSLDLEALIARKSISDKQATILRTLSEKKGRPVRTDALIHALYDDDPDGGPDDARNTLFCHIRNLRLKLQGSPIQVRSVRHQGYSLVTAPERANAARL